MAKPVQLTGDATSLVRALDAAIDAFSKYEKRIQGAISMSDAQNKQSDILAAAMKKLGDATAQLAKKQADADIENQRRLTASAAARQASYAMKEQQLKNEAMLIEANNAAEERALKKSQNTATRRQANLKRAHDLEIQASRERIAIKEQENRIIEAGSYAQAARQELLAKKQIGINQREALQQTRIRAELERTNRQHAHQLRLMEMKSRVDMTRQIEQIRQVSRATQEAAHNTYQFGQGLKTISRILAVSIGYRAFYGLVRAFNEGTRQAIEFQRSIAGVQTISQEANLSARQWADGLQQVSDGWRLDILEQTEAAYQALTNQVVRGTDAFEFLESANRFATAAFVETNEAVRLVTAAMNAYGNSAGDAERIFASFFKTIELGRVRGGELTELGRILLPARTIGVELDEVNAALSTLTIQGVKANEAMTFLRNIFQAMIKPTTGMKAFLDELGVSSGQAAIQTFGFVGFMRMLEERFKGSSEELGQLFGRIRGLAGIFGLTGSALDKLDDNFQKISASSQSYARAVDIVRETSGEKLEIALSKVRNIFIRMGSDFLDQASRMTDGFNTIYKVGREMARMLRYIVVPAVVAVTAAFTKMAVAFVLTPWGAVVAGVTAVSAALYYLASNIERNNDAMRALAEEQVYALREAARQQKEISDKSFEDQRKLRQAEQREVQQGLAQVITIANQEADARIRGALQWQDGAKRAAEAVSGYFKDSVKNSQDAIKSSIDAMNRALGGIAALDPNTDQTIFNWELEKLQGQEALDFIAGRMADLFTKAAEASRLGDINLFENLERQLLQLNELQKATQDRIVAANEQANSKAMQLLRNRQKAEEDFAKKTEELNRKLADGKTSDEERARLMQEQTRLVEDHRSKLTLISDELAAIERHDININNYITERSDIFDRLIELREELASVAEREAAAEEQRLKTLLIDQSKVEQALKTLSGFSIADIMKIDDPEALRVAVNEQERAYATVQDIVRERELAVDLTYQELQLADRRYVAQRRLVQLQAKERQEQARLAFERSEAMQQELKEDQDALRERDTRLQALRTRITTLFPEDLYKRLFIGERGLPGAGIRTSRALATDFQPNISELQSRIRDALDSRDLEQFQAIVAELRPTLEKLEQARDGTGKIATDYLALLTEYWAELIGGPTGGEAFLDLQNRIKESEEGIQSLRKAAKDVIDQQNAAQGIQNTKLQETLNLLQRIREEQTRIQDIRVQPFSTDLAPQGPTTSNTFGPMTININSTGNVKYDVDALQVELQRRQRLQGVR